MDGAIPQADGEDGQDGDKEIMDAQDSDKWSSGEEDLLNPYSYWDDPRHVGRIERDYVLDGNR